MKNKKNCFYRIKKNIKRKNIYCMMKKIVLLFLIFFIGFVAAECIDSDGDGYGKTGLDCSFSASDCDDSNPAINPNAKEICGNSVDEDCNGKDLTCFTCPQGQINFRCSCGGQIKESGYCCDNSFQADLCPSCPTALGINYNCNTENGCPGLQGCIIWTPEPFQYTQCYDVPDSCPCLENWDCSDWSSCTNGKTIRVCNDLSSCGTQKLKPATQKTCSAETKIFNARILKTTLKENELITVIVSYNNNPLASVKAVYAGKTFLTDSTGKTSFNAVFEQTKINLSKDGFISSEIMINVIKENFCGNNYCDAGETSSCPQDCINSSGINLVVPETVNEGKEFSVKVTDLQGNALQGKTVSYGLEQKITDSQGKTVFTAKKEFTSVSVKGEGITKKISVISSGYCGDSVCQETENSESCFADCFNSGEPANIAIIAFTVIALIFFMLVLISVK